MEFFPVAERLTWLDPRLSWRGTRYLHPLKSPVSRWACIET